MQGKNYYHGLILGFVCVCSFFVHLGVFEPDLMEARNFVTAREMVEEGNYLLPEMNAKPRLEKPPLPTWMTAIMYRFQGETLFFLRLPAALIATMLVFFFHALLRRIFDDKETALVGAIALASFPMIVEMGRTGSWDIFCQAFMLGAVFFLYNAFQQQQTRYGLYLMAGIFIGLSAMSKGPVAIYGMLLPFLIAYGMSYGYKNIKAHLTAITAMLLVAIGIASWWYIYVRLEVPEISTQIANKEVEAWSNRHTRPFWFYLSFPLFTGAWLAFLLPSFAYKKFVTAKPLGKAYKVAFWWALWTLFLLSVIPEKKERYLLPIFPPLAMLVTFAFHKLRNEGYTGLGRIAFLSFAILLLLIALAGPPGLYALFVSKGYMSWGALLAAGLLLLAVAAIVIMAIKKQNAMQLVFSAVVVLAVVTTFVLPALPEFKYKNPDYREIGVIQNELWYSEQAFYTDLDLNLKAIWRVGKPVTMVLPTESWPADQFILISENTLPELLKPLENERKSAIHLGTYDYFRKKSKHKLHVYQVPAIASH
jgi:4-amino-4-deoxy-L-arabinose transferase-like glycosyltransferase